MVLAGAGVYGYGHLTGNDTNGLANVWIDTTTANNTCVYSTTAVAYDDTKACSSFAAAYAFSAAGGTAIVKCGSYDNQAFASGSSHTAMTVFRSENPLCATVQSSSATDTFVFGNGSKYITLDGFTINNGPDGYPISDTSSVGTNINTDHISLLNNYINVGVKGNGLLVSLHASQNWIIDGNTFGPSCCGATAGPSLEGIRVGKPNNTTPSNCTNTACHIQITNNLFQFLNRAAATWPSSGWGGVPDVSCPTCHNDAIHFFGAQDVQINYNRFYGDECNGIFFESSGNSTTSDVDIIGNAISELANGCNGGVAFNFVGTGWAGTFNIKFNSSAPQYNLNFNTTAAFNVNVTGNYGPLNVNGSGTSACGTGTGAPNVTLTFAYNVWTTATACTGGDTAGESEDWVSFDPAPAVGQNMHTSSGSTAIGFVPTAVTGGCPSVDFDGDVPSSPCNAGADQSSAETTGASLAICSPSPCTTGVTPSGSSGGTNFVSLGNISDGVRSQARSLAYSIPVNLKHDGSADGSPAALFYTGGGGGTCGGAAIGNEFNDSKAAAAAVAYRMVIVMLQPEDCNVSGHRTGWAHPQIDCTGSVCGSTSVPTDEPYIAAAYNWACSGAGVAILHLDCDRLYMSGASSGGAIPREVQCDNVYGNATRFRGVAWISNSPNATGAGAIACPSGNKTTFTMHVIGMSSGSDATSTNLGPLVDGHLILSFDNTRAAWAGYLGTCGTAVSTAIGTPSAANTQYDYTCTGASTPMFRAVKIINGGHSYCNLDNVQGTPCTGNVPPTPTNPTGTNRNGWSTMLQEFEFFASGSR